MPVDVALGSRLRGNDAMEGSETPLRIHLGFDGELLDELASRADRRRASGLASTVVVQHHSLGYAAHFALEHKTAFRRHKSAPAILALVSGAVEAQLDIVASNFAISSANLPLPNLF
ncbi:MAG: hypothetical protein HLUCCA04_04880 [Oceanicaulis sp. HLUCCA04]|nr:MAG: hypothetical protein HLUCCA04_04880 [Oceanicaulis sp. HLUCCA04]